jgi:uncharacterized coiled-coil DUF342 family protein
MRERPELRLRKEGELIKTAEQAWKRLRAGADPVAWDAKRKVESSLAEVNNKMKKLRDTLSELKKHKQKQDMTKGEISKMNELVVEVDKLRPELRKWNAANAAIWLDTWHAEISKKRDQALDNALSSFA